jgi:hypothetical protein
LENKEELKIKQTIKKFADEMKKKMLEKFKEGYHGWDDRERFPDLLILGKLHEHVERLVHYRLSEEIDIANFCMMLWYRKKQIKETGK